MANVKKEPLSLDFQIEELKKKIVKIDEDIKSNTERMQKENELVAFHKSKVKKYSDVIRNLDLEKKVLRMDLMDLRADIAQVDRVEYFENVMSAAEKNTPKIKPEEKVDGANAPSTTTDDTSISPDEKTEDSNESEDNITSLEKARAEFNKKHPDGISIAERSKQAWNS